MDFLWNICYQGHENSNYSRLVCKVGGGFPAHPSPPIGVRGWQLQYDNKFYELVAGITDKIW